MSSVSASMKKLRKKRESFDMKMKSLLRVDKDSDADLSQLNDMNCTFTLNPDDVTHPKQVYDTPKDIIFEAFRCEVLNADTHSRK